MNSVDTKSTDQKTKGLTIYHEDEDDDEDMRHLLDNQSPDQEDCEEDSGSFQLVVILPCLAMMTTEGAQPHITSASLDVGELFIHFLSRAKLFPSLTT